MRIAEHDTVDLAVMAAILSNFAPDRVNPLWFVLITGSEAGKSMLLDVILEDWRPSWKMATTISPAYFFSARTEEGALVHIDKQKKRILYMRDMAALVALPQIHKNTIHAQLIGIYDGELKHSTGMQKREQIHKRGPEDRLGWIGAATEAFYDRFLLRTYAVGARFTPYYWQRPRRARTDTSDLEQQREMRGKRLTTFNPTRKAVQAFLDEAIKHAAKDFHAVELTKFQGQRIDAATRLAMWVIGSGKTEPAGGRTADRATQFARSAAFLSGSYEVEPEHGDMGLRLVLSQLAPEYQHLLGYAVREDNIGRWWRLQDFLEEIGGRRIHYSEWNRGGPLEHMTDVGVVQTRIARAKKYQEAGRTMEIRISDDALKLVKRFDPALLALPRQDMAKVEAVRDEDPAPESVPDDPAEIALAELDKLN